MRQCNKKEQINKITSHCAIQNVSQMDVEFVPPEYSPQQREEVKKYIVEHPDIKAVIQELMVAIMTNKPENPIEFAREYFNSLKSA